MRILKRSFATLARHYVKTIICILILYHLVRQSRYTSSEREEEISFLTDSTTIPNNLTRMDILSDWEPSKSRNMKDYLLPENNTVLIEPQHLSKNKTFVLIMVCSAVKHFNHRHFIRKTWGNTTQFNYNMFAAMHGHFPDIYKKPDKRRIEFYRNYLGKNENKSSIPSNIPVHVIYLVGRDKNLLTENETNSRLLREAQRYDDILQQDFIDTYNNLTIKSVMALKWVTQRCPRQYAFFMKCDDDTFVNIPNLLNFLLGGMNPLYNMILEYKQDVYHLTVSHDQLYNFLTGGLLCSAPPINDVFSKWYTPRYMYEEDKYPKFLSGSAYLMTIDVVEKMYKEALNTSLMHLEDVYLTGIIAKRIKTRPRLNPLFLTLLSKDFCSVRGCITQHRVKKQKILGLYRYVTNPSINCTPQNKTLILRDPSRTKNCV